MIKNTIIKYDNLFQRFFEILPGFLLWFVVTSPFWMSFSFPQLLSNLIIVLAVYWLYRGVIFNIGLIIGYKRYKEAITIDWLSKCNDLNLSLVPDKNLLPKNSTLPKHLIVYPIGSAQYDIVKETLNALNQQNYPKELIYISLSFEQRLIDKNPEYFAEMKANIKQDFAQFEDRIMIFDHPGDIAGEAIGAAANRTWGTRMAVEELERRGENLNDFLTTSPDEDIRFHPEFLGTISYRYLINEKRNQKFYQTAVYMFDNNYWQVPMLIRVWSLSLTLPALSTSVTNRHDRETWSCYTINLQVMKDVNYWDTSIGIDDTLFYWRPFDYFNGDFTCDVFYVPLYADAVYHPNKVQNYVAQYKQLVRWGWGVIVFPIATRVLLTNEKIPLLTKIQKFVVMFEVFVLQKVIAIIFTITVPVLSFSNEAFNYSIYAYSLPTTLSLIMRLLTLLFIPGMLMKLKFMPKRPHDMSVINYWVNYLMEVPLHFVILFTYAFFPFVVGPTWMMFGRKYEFIITDKKK